MGQSKTRRGERWLSSVSLDPLMERLKNIAVIVGLLLSITTLYTWGSKLFSHEIIAHLQPGAFALPPQLDSFYAKLGETLKTDAFEKRVLSDESFKTIYVPKDISNDQMAAVVRGVTRSLPNASDVAIPYEFRSVATLWTGSVVNSSKTRVSTCTVVS